jgi:hypothetical protein
MGYDDLYKLILNLTMMMMTYSFRGTVGPIDKFLAKIIFLSIPM